MTAFRTQTHGVLLQYLELLTSPTVISPQDYANKILPSIAELGIVYGICPPICMQAIRPVLHASLLVCYIPPHPRDPRLIAREL